MTDLAGRRDERPDPLDDPTSDLTLDLSIDETDPAEVNPAAEPEVESEVESEPLVGRRAALLSLLRGRVREAAWPGPGPGWRSIGPGLALTAAITYVLLRLPLSSVVPGVDGSFQLGLHLADEANLVHGRDVIYTYGPLGHLFAPMAIAGRSQSTTQAAVFFVAASWIAVSAWIVVVARRWGRGSWWRYLAVAALLVGVEMLLHTGSTAVAGFAVLTAASDRRLPAWAAVVGPALAAPLILVKFDAVGPTFALIFALCGRYLIQDGLKRGAGLAALTVATAVVAPLAVWVRVDQPAGTFLPWIRESLAIAAGYAENMFDNTATTWTSIAIILAGSAVAVMTAAARTDLVAKQRALAALTVAGLCFMSVKAVYGHGLQWWTGLAIFVLVSAVRPGDHLRLAQAIVLTAVPVISYGSGIGYDLDSVVELRSTTFEIAFDAERNETVGAERRDGAIDYFSNQDILLDALDGAAVHVSPWEITLLHTLPSTEWAPLPLLQDYVAYSSRLDEINAAALRSEDRPPTIVRLRGAALPGRYYRWDSPETVLEMACRYDFVVRSYDWVVSEAAEGSRCAPSEEIDVQTVRFGDTVDVPRAPRTGAIVARFEGLRDGTSDTVKRLLWRRDQVFAHLEIKGDVTAYRLLLGHAEGRHILSLPNCAARPLDGEPLGNVSSFTLSDAAAAIAGSERYVVAFEFVPMDCSRR